MCIQKSSAILSILSRIKSSEELQYKFNSKIVTYDGFTIDVFSMVIDFELLKNSLKEVVQVAKNYIGSEEKEY